MRKILIMFLLLILILALGLVVVKGLTINVLKVQSVQDIIALNKNLEDQILALNNKKDISYELAKGTLNKSVNSLTTTKQEYQDKLTYSTEEEINAAHEIDKYEIGYLWTKIGLHAKNSNVEIQVDFSTSGNKINDEVVLCNMSFTVIGEYLPISEFIYAIENDSDLGFRIRDFSLVPYSENNLQARFTITDVGLNSSTLEKLTNVVPTTDTDTEKTSEEEPANE